MNRRHWWMESVLIMGGAQIKGSPLLVTGHDIPSYSILELQHNALQFRRPLQALLLVLRLGQNIYIFC